MSDENVSVTFTGDASGVAPAAQQVVGDVQGIATQLAQLNTQFAAFAATMKEAMASGTAGTAGLASEMKVLEAETAKEEVSLLGLAASAKGAGESVLAIKAAIFGFGEVMMAVFAVEFIKHWAEGMAEASEKVEHLRQQFGMTVQEITQMQGVAQAVGVSVDALTRGMGIMDRNMVNSQGSTSKMAHAFSELGISADDGRSQMEKLLVVADKFHDMDKGPLKAALAMTIFGRAGKELIPILDLGREGILKIKDAEEEYGAASMRAGDFVDVAQQKGLALAESMNENKLAWDGVSNVMKDAFAPSIKTVVDGISELVKAFVDSYREGGIVKDIFVGIGAAVEVFMEVVRALAEVFSAVWDVVSTVTTEILGAIAEVFGIKGPSNVNILRLALNEFKDVLTIVKDAVIIFVTLVGANFEALAAFVRAFAAVVNDALTFNWGSIEGDWQRGMDHVADIVEKAKTKIVNAANEMAAAIAAAASGSAVADPKHGLDLGKDEDNGDGSFQTTPSKKPAKDKSSEELQQWKEELAEKLNDEKNWGADEAALTEQFWAEKLTQVKQGSKEWLAVEQEYQKARRAVFKEDQADEIADIKTAQAERIDATKSQNEQDKIALNEKLDAINQQEKLEQISGVKAAQERAAVNAQLRALAEKEAEDEYQIKLKSIRDELALELLPSEQRKQLNRQLEELELQHENTMATMRKADEQKTIQDTNTTALAIENKWKSIFSPIVSAWGSAVDQMIHGSMSLKQAMASIGDAILQEGIQWIEKLVLKWLTSEVAKTGATVTGVATRTTAEATGAATSEAIGAQSALVQIAQHAAKAAAGAYAAIAQIPIVGPVLAPIAAGVALAAVIAFGKMIFSAEGGWDKVPMDGAQTVLHKDEMVLSAQFANPLRDLLTSGAFSTGPVGLVAQQEAARSNDNGDEVGSDRMGGGGEVHIHLTAIDTQSGVKFINDNRRVIAQSVKQAVREGTRPR